MKFYLPVLAIGLLSCLNKKENTIVNATPLIEVPAQQKFSAVPAAKKHFRGALVGGFKGDSISFDVAADGKKLENLTFKGYWRCSGKLEQLRAVGPEGFYTISNGAVKGHISDPPDGGSTAWRFDIDAKFAGNTATGTFRMNINNLGCDTYLLKFSAVAK